MFGEDTVPRSFLTINARSYHQLCYSWVSNVGGCVALLSSKTLGINTPVRPDATGSLRQFNSYDLNGRKLSRRNPTLP